MFCAVLFRPKLPLPMFIIVQTKPFMVFQFARFDVIRMCSCMYMLYAGVEFPFIPETGGVPLVPFFAYLLCGAMWGVVLCGV